MATSVQSCFVCSDNFIVKTKFINCDNCLKPFHLHCAKVKDQLLKLKQDCVNIKWFCEICLPSVNVFLGKQTCQFAKNEELLEKTSKLIELLESNSRNITNSNCPQTYADVIKKNSEPLIIKPKNTNQNSSTTKNVLTQKLSPSDLKISLSEITQGSQGRIMIHCQDKHSLEKLKTNVEKELGAEYEIKVGNLQKPKIKIINVKSEDVNDPNEFVNIFQTQNIPDELISSEIKIIRKFKSTNSKESSFNIILELSPKEFNYIITKKNKIHIGWNVYKFFEFVSVIRCFRCWRFGHFADKCKSEYEICPFCGDNHRKDQCSNGTKFTCINCKHARDELKMRNIEVNHHVFDQNCPCYQRQIALKKKRINYEL